MATVIDASQRLVAGYFHWMGQRTLKSPCIGAIGPAKGSHRGLSGHARHATTGAHYMLATGGMTFAPFGALG